MDQILEYVARATISARLGDAEGLRRGHRHALARRLGRRAEAAARRAAVAEDRSW